MINIKKLYKTYSGGVKAVADLNLEVKNGEIFGFLGPNGAGKSTTIKCIVGLLKPSSGKIIINGFDNQIEPVKAKETIGYVADEPLVMDKLKGIEYLNFISNVFEIPPELRLKRLDYLLKIFKLTDSINDPVMTYSHGMKQKLSLIAALIHNPDLWILDEPIVGLDPESAYNLKEMMKSHTKNGKTVFFSTHVMEIAEKICDRVGIISKGKLIYVGTIKALKETKNNESLEKIFLEVTGSENEKSDFSYLDSI
jgi:ABC-2 type transport system ATP-binding protein